MNYNATLRAAIAAAIHTPADPPITGAALQSKLLAIVDGIDAGAVFLGVVTPASIPTTEANCFFLAVQPGTYANFTDTGGTAIALAEGETAFISSVVFQDSLRWQKLTISQGGRIGAFKFVNNVPAVEAAFEASGIGTPYTSAIDGIAADASTLSIILLMSTAKATPAKTYMIATQEVTPATSPATYEFFYAGDLQSAMPSNVLTADKIDNDFVGGSDMVAGATEVKEQLVITETSTITGTKGKLDTSGILDTSNNSYGASDFIKVSEGDVIVYKATANANTGAVCGYSGNTEDTFISLLLKGQTSGGNPVTFDNEVNIPSGIEYIRVSYAYSPYSNNITLLHYKYLKDRVTALEEKQEEIGNIVEEIPDFNRSYEAPFDLVNVRLLKTNGVGDSNSTYNATTYISIKEGQKAIYTGTGNTSLVVNLAGYSDNQGNGYVSLLVGNSYNNREVTIPSGVNYIRACAKKDSPYSLTVIETVFDVYDKKFAAITDKFKGKVIAVIGDSISTGSGLNPFWIVRQSDVGNQIESWVTYYDIFTSNGSPTNKSIGGILLTAEMIGTKQTFTPVQEDVNKSIGVSVTYYANSNGWAYQLCEKLGATLINASWSGSSMNSGQVTIVNDVNQDSCSYGWHDCTIGRCSNRDNEGNVINPDVIIIYRGTNDFSHSPYAYLDDYDINSGYPETDVYEVDKYGFERAYYLTIAKLRVAYPNAYIFCATLNIFKRGIRDKFPVRCAATGRNYSLPDMNDAIRKIADKMGCGIINFDKSGITFENCYPNYINDSADMPTHPNSTGQMVLANRAFVDLNYYIQTS